MAEADKRTRRFYIDRKFEQANPRSIRFFRQSLPKTQRGCRDVCLKVTFLYPKGFRMKDFSRCYREMTRDLTPSGGLSLAECDKGATESSALQIRP
jgi:hypothetical protein